MKGWFLRKKNRVEEGEGGGKRVTRKWKDKTVWWWGGGGKTTTTGAAEKDPGKKKRTDIVLGKEMRLL